MKNLIVQFVKFFGISGIGWCIDFGLYIVFTQILGWPVFQSNCLSSIPAVTLVFFVSTRKIFKKADSKIPVGIKYIVYLIYQAVLLTFVSMAGQHLAILIGRFWTSALVKILVKIVITPFTMVANFFVMKAMTEHM